jgi:hypothetical protein
MLDIGDKALRAFSQDQKGVPRSKPYLVENLVYKLIRHVLMKQIAHELHADDGGLLSPDRRRQLSFPEHKRPFSCQRFPFIFG